MKLELIQSVNPVIPSKGANAGKQMFVINGIHWSKIEPKADDTHVCLEDVDIIVTPAVDAVPATETSAEIPAKPAVTKTYVNVIGFSKDVRMTIGDKIKTITSHDAGYSQAIAYLLK